MKKLVAVVATLAASTAFAQQPTTGTGLGAATYKQMARTYPGKILDMRLDVADKNWDERQQAYKTQPGLARDLHEAFSDPALIEQLEIEVGKLHAAHFTPEELKELDAFYKTPTGAKLLAKMPMLTTSSVAIGQKIALRQIAQVMAKNQSASK
jgi:hypothetical protein